MPTNHNLCYKKCLKITSIEEILKQTDWVTQYDQSLALLQKNNQLFAGFLNHGLKNIRI